MTPKTLIIRTAGTNCDRELAKAFELAGASCTTVHLNELLADPARLEAFDLIGLPGGFSYGDDIAAGRIFANRLKHGLYEPLRACVERGVPMIGPCNGFQVMVKLGLLPTPAAEPKQTVTLSHNDSGRFIDRWTPVRVEADTKCVWTRGLKDHELPMAHAEGRFVAPDDVLDALEANGQVTLRYRDNPNGSARDIAGVCDPSGLVFGLMPHPERHLHFTNHPTWTRMSAEERAATPTGLRYFENAVAYVRERAGVGV